MKTSKTQDLISISLIIIFMIVAVKAYSQTKDAILFQNQVITQVIHKGEMQATETTITELVIFKEAIDNQQFPFEIDKEVLKNLAKSESRQDRKVLVSEKPLLLR
ncbi:hypothetical protein J8281_02650 [Aquimarina sp. U1-2]|uniref:hypothetical protein n=1 Tax=Aquimarina sp. U1-2 TaxID=2823141 RepID=UPI001AEC8156|nr:hypothetical protein [Aquimarina sp. U1-2]MBP2831076.1 hypothetical protein [Aquimarina sp. U1-2]